MRSRSLSRGMREIFLASLALAAGGCSAGGSQDTLQTSSLPARPEAAMSREPPSAYAQGDNSSPSFRPYSSPSYVPSDPPRTASLGATNTNSYSSDNRWRPNPQPSYAAAPSYQPQYRQQPYQAPYQPQPYQQQAYQPQPYQPRWQPPPQQQPYAAPITTGSLGPAKSQTVVVREGDTLYGLSRRHGVPVAELVTANRISDGKIQIGQTLVIPTNTR
jgi:hypothetical protein